MDKNRAYANGDDGYLWLTCDECEAPLMEIEAGTTYIQIADAVQSHDCVA